MIGQLEAYIQKHLLNTADKELYITHLITISIIIVFTIVLLWVIKHIILKRFSKRAQIRGNLVALLQLIQYVVWVIAAFFVLESLGVKMSMLFAGSAALLVGVGLGLQQTFNDFVSGIIILVERSIKIGDILEVDDHVVKIQAIRLRTSRAIDRDDIALIIPNSHLVTSKMINWSHQSKKTRFMIPVGVSYASDIEKVMEVLEECVRSHGDILSPDSVEVRLVEFAASTIVFHVLFFSDYIFRIERIKSDIRKTIVKRFHEEGIVFPFPQMDVHLKKEV